ncbi:MAG: DUF308 domain-containing protein [Paracoccaceae bacterium]
MPNWGILVIVGVLSILAGIVALAFPLPASLTVNAFVGASLAVAGVLGTIGAAREAAGRDRGWGILLGLATLALGVVLLAWPLQGLTTLTIVAGVIFLASGVFKLVLGWNLAIPSWKWAVVLSGLLSVVLGVMMLTHLPASAMVVPGLLLAVELLSYGWGLVFLGIAWKRGANL